MKNKKNESEDKLKLQKMANNEIVERIFENENIVITAVENCDVKEFHSYSMQAEIYTYLEYPVFKVLWESEIY